MAMIRALLILMLAVPAMAGPLTYWASDGGYKVPQEDFTPNTTGYVWHSSQVYMSSARNETIGFVLYMNNTSTYNVTNANVSISSFTGASGGIVSVAVSSGNVWDTTTRPIEQFLVKYLPIQGASLITWGQYDQQHLPTRMRLPCTMGSGQCSANGGTVFADRPDANKHYPDILVPYEFFPSSFTVYASSSQAVWFDVYVSTSLAAGLYTSSITVKTGSDVDRVIPVNLTVRDFTLPQAPTFRVMAHVGSADISERMQDERWPADPQTAPYVTSRKKFYQMLHRHGISPIGNDKMSADNPYAIDIDNMNGNLYVSSAGYGNARGVGVGGQMYSIGTYGQWQSEWSGATSNPATLCGHVSNWATWFKNNAPDVTAFLYLTDENMTGVAGWSSTMSNNSSCQVSGYKVNSFVTYDFPDVRTNAPALSMPCTQSYMGVSSATWESANTHFQQGLTPGTTQGWEYNGIAPWTGTAATEDDGISPVVIMWANLKKGIAGHFLWETTYWYNFQGGMALQDLFTNAHTFGSYTSTDSQLGRTGWNYTNGDGLWMYPANDEVFPSSSYGVDAAIASWRLKMMRRGIQDADYIYMARQADEEETNAIVEGAVPLVLWEKYCYEEADCTYHRGPRTWSADPDIWIANREAIAALIPSDGGSPYCGDGICNGSDTCSNCPTDCGICPGRSMSGSFRFTGGGQIR